jgi:hypothetical protein
VVLWRLRYKLSLRDLVEMFALRGEVFSRHVRFQGFRIQNSIRFLVPVATSDAGMHGGGRALSDG